jgi:hypothetical protein
MPAMRSRAFKQGQVNNRQSMARSAMAALVANPKNERALQALASVDPASRPAVPATAAAAASRIEQHRDNIVKGAPAHSPDAAYKEYVKASCS